MRLTYTIRMLWVALMAMAMSASALIPPSATEQFVYDALGNRIGFYNAEGKPITFGFDAQGRVTAITNAIGNVTRYAYDANGNLVDRQDAKNEVTHYSYNSMNRLTNVVHQGAWKASFAHDLAGNLINQQSPIGNQQFSYDSMNRLASSLISVNSRTFAITNSYDLNGNRTNITYPGGLTVGYEYDEENRLKKVIANRANLTNQFSFGYDSASRLTSMSYPNGVNSSFGYDAENRVTSLSHGSFINRAITRDARGYKTDENIITGLEPVMTNGQQKLTHNAADQLTHIDQRDTWFGGELNQWYNRDYTYDLNGNLAREAVTRPSWNTNTAIPEYTVNYTNDYDNRILSVSSVSSVVQYLYDASGARIARIAGVSPAVTNYFVLDYKAPLKMPLAEADALGRITRYYVWGTQGLLCHLDMNPTNGALLATRYYHGDELGSTLALTDQNGTLTDQFAYSPHGEVWGRTGSADTPYLWLGGLAVRSEGNGLYFMLNRYYSANLRRFLSIDPSGIDSFPNLYTYGDMNSANLVDPTGLDTYRQNRWLSTLDSSGRSATWPLTHTFVYTTNPDGTLEHTYSWGNTYENGKGVWRMDRDEDKHAANQAIDNPAVRGPKIGDESFDGYVDQAYRELRNDPNSPSLHANGIIVNNCKTEATRLTTQAAQLQNNERSASTRSTSSGTIQK